ncbi:hypothetical protein, partial [Acinetobacter qingfengensis]
MKRVNSDKLKDSIGKLFSNATGQQMTSAILAWLREEKYFSNSKEFKEYGLDKFIKINEFDYPIGMTNDSINRDYLYRVVSSYSNLGSIAMSLRDILYILIYFKVDKVCPRCEWGDAFVLKSPSGIGFYYECYQCGTIFDKDYNFIDISQFIYLKSDDIV